MSTAKKPPQVQAPAPNTRDNKWTRPVAMQKDSQIRNWLLFFGVVLIGAALWTPVRTLWTRYTSTKPTYAVDARSGANSFLAIAYYGVSEEAVNPGSQDTLPEVFRRHVDELAGRGYVTIDLEDVRKFYQEKKPLPQKALLLTFEQSRKTSYFETRSILNAHKWRAVMGVWTDPIHKGDPQALLWPYLSDMLAMGTWDLAAQSNKGFDYIPAGPNGETGPFFTTPKWLPVEQRYEIPTEFVTRLEKDHKSIMDEFQKKVKEKPQAFFFPYGDYGQYDSNARIIREVNLREVGTNYVLGFTLGALALNTQFSDPRRLNRLLVNPNWSAKELGDKLDAFQPYNVDRSNKLRSFPAMSWVREWGNVTVDNEELRLRAVPPENPADLINNTQTTGAKAWLAGSDVFKDGFLSMRFQIKRGRYVLYMRATPTGEYLCFTLDNLGNVSLRQRDAFSEERILAVDTLTNEARTDFDLLVGLRDNLVYLRLNGKLLFGGRVLTLGDPLPGMVGVSVWDEVEGIGDINVISTKMIARQDALLTWTPEMARNISYMSDWMNQNSYRFSVISPPWIRIESSVPLVLPPWNTDVISLMSRINNAPICPMISIRDANFLPRISQVELADDLKKLKASGVYVDASQVTEEQFVLLADWLIRMKANLDPDNLTLMVKLPQVLEKLPSTGNMLHQIKGVRLVGDFLEPPFDLRWNELLTEIYIPADLKGGPLSLYYQINALPDGEGSLTPAAQAELLRQKGFNSFVLGDYAKAIEAWQAWHKLMPANPAPLALEGDAWLRLENMDKALACYTSSLELNPGQVDLAIRRARLLEKMGHKEEQVAMLNMYACAFPNTPILIMEQARWLITNNRRDEARDLMRKLVKEHPEEIEARQILQGLLDSPSERYENIRGLLELSRKGETTGHEFARMLYTSNLLAVPEAAVCFEFIRESVGSARSRQTRELYQSLVPLQTIIDEEFKGGFLSDHWEAFGSHTRVDEQGRYEIKAGSDMAEAYLRLKRSELMRDGYLEVVLDESVGFFWVYARRSAGAMIRFGFDDEGFVRIQCWLNNDLVASESRTWLRPAGTLKIALEVRGDGAQGYVNGKPVFQTGLAIPNGLCYGWWSVAPFSPELGMARAKIGRLCGMSLPSTMLIVPRIEEEDVPAFLDAARPYAMHLSAISPILFVQRQDGTIVEDEAFPVQMIRMFASFHRLRMMPVADLSYYAEIDPKIIINLIKKHNLTALCLCLRSVPSEKWRADLERLLEETPANICIIQSMTPFWSVHEEDRTLGAMLETEPAATFYQLERGNLFASPVKNRYEITAHAMTGEIKSPIPQTTEARAALAAKVDVPEFYTPRVYVYPSTYIPPERARELRVANPTL